MLRASVAPQKQRGGKGSTADDEYRSKGIYLHCFGWNWWNDHRKTEAKKYEFISAQDNWLQVLHNVELPNVK